MNSSSTSGRLTRDRAVRLRWRDVPLRQWLAAFTLVVALAIVGMWTVTVIHTRDVATAVARQAAENLAESLSEQAADTFEAVDGALLSLSERIATDGGRAGAREHLRESMAALVTTMPRLHGLLVVDEHGRFVVSNVSSAARPDLQFGDRAYFRFHRDHPGPSVHITGPAGSDTEDVSVISVTRRLSRADGSFGGVAIAQIAASYFERNYASVDVGLAGTIKLIADDRTLMVRVPRAFIGVKLSRSPIFADPLKYEMAGFYVGSSSLDGLTRLHAFRRLGRYPLVVEAALAQSDYLAEWASDAKVGSIFRGCVIAVIAAFAWALGAQMDRRKDAEAALARLALLDGLTGIANRRQFDAMLEREWRVGARDRTPLALLMIDVDNFKLYNDHYGHLQGDDALVSIARSIQTSVARPSDLAARYGGEEFAVILPATDVRSAATVAERIRRDIATRGIPHAGVPRGFVSVSIGVASVVPGGTDEHSALIEAADAALYEAKRSGRDRVALMAGAARMATPAAGS